MIEFANVLYFKIRCLMMTYLGIPLRNSFKLKLV